MRIIGIDYGTKRVGIAISDEEAKFALPVSVLQNVNNNLTKEIKEIASKNNVKEIVLGESKNYKGEANASLPEATQLKESLEKEGFIVHWEPEFMTSMHVERLQGKTSLTDASAAAIILQSYLDKRR